MFFWNKISLVDLVQRFPPLESSVRSDKILISGLVDPYLLYNFLLLMKHLSNESHGFVSFL